MPRYTDERKAQVLSLLRPPHNLTLAQVCKKEGISRTTMYIWLEEKTSDAADWSAEAKFTALIDTANLNPEQLLSYCKKNGIAPVQLQEWKSAFLHGEKAQPLSGEENALAAVQQRIAELERELAFKDKALADAMVFFVTQKRLGWDELGSKV